MSLIVQLSVTFVTGAVLTATIYFVMKLGIPRMVKEALTTQEVKISTRIDHDIPLVFKQPLQIPVHATLKLSIDEMLDIETVIPIDVELPVDTVVQTNVLGLGNIKIPIKTVIPLRMEVPLKRQIRVRSSEFSVPVAQTLSVRPEDSSIRIDAQLPVKIQLA